MGILINEMRWNTGNILYFQLSWQRGPMSLWAAVKEQECPAGTVASIWCWRLVKILTTMINSLQKLWPPYGCKKVQPKDQSHIQLLHHTLLINIFDINTTLLHKTWHQFYVDLMSGNKALNWCHIDVPIKLLKLKHFAMGVIFFVLALGW